MAENPLCLFVPSAITIHNLGTRDCSSVPSPSPTYPVDFDTDAVDTGIRRVGRHRYVPRGGPIIDEAIVDLSHPILCQSSKNPACRFVYFFDVSTSSERLAEKTDHLAAIF